MNKICSWYNVIIVKACKTINDSQDAEIFNTRKAISIRMHFNFKACNWPSVTVQTDYCVIIHRNWITESHKAFDDHRCLRCQQKTLESQSETSVRFEFWSHDSKWQQGDMVISYQNFNSNFKPHLNIHISVMLSPSC